MNRLLLKIVLPLMWVFLYFLFFFFCKLFIALCKRHDLKKFFFKRTLPPQSIFHLNICMSLLSYFVHPMLLHNKLSHIAFKLSPIYIVHLMILLVLSRCLQTTLLPPSMFHLVWYEAADLHFILPQYLKNNQWFTFHILDWFSVTTRWN